MKTIYIKTKILDGNLGDGWIDNEEAARALAACMEETWRADLADYLSDGFDIEINIEVESPGSGYSGQWNVVVNLGGDDFDDEIKLAYKIENELTPENLVWDAFIHSRQAILLME